MKKRKSTLQKISSITGIICFLLAILCAIALYFKVQELGMQHVVSASLLASSFFCAFIGFVFMVFGNADIPGLKLKVAVTKNNPSDSCFLSCYLTKINMLASDMGFNVRWVSNKVRCSDEFNMANCRR